MRGKVGYTFIEVIISLSLVALGAIMFSAMMPMASRGARFVGNYQQASSLVQHKIDELRSVGYGRLTFSELRSAGIIDATPTTLPYSFTTSDSLTSIFPSATGTINLTDFSPTIKQVTVTLTWTGSALKQGNGSLQAVALIAKG